MNTRLQCVAVNILLVVLMIIYVNYPDVALCNAPKGPSSIIIYNRVPKTGSTTLVNAVMYDLCKLNNFNVIHLNLTRAHHIMNLADQNRFVQNITAWTQRLPAIYHGHSVFIDFTLFGRPNPIYINLIREPFERLLSHYYFLRYGDDYRVGLKRSRAGNNETFDECVERRGRDCDVNQMWMQIPYFCGSAYFCHEPGNERALELAKKNLVEHYLLVGISERMREFIGALEVVLPEFFYGGLKHFDSLDEKRSHLRYTKKKIPPSKKTIKIVKSQTVYKMEYEFYQFAIKAFENNVRRLLNAEGEYLSKQQFHYEKIKPQTVKS
uniref:Heparan sulfate 2-O-sulfotransferase n=1 Tax=Syphacia muris TaxID=451379 RepID=A0A0N5B010_9BILA